jgi:hypothetical protein
MRTDGRKETCSWKYCDSPRLPYVGYCREHFSYYRRLWKQVKKKLLKMEATSVN